MTTDLVSLDDQQVAVIAVPHPFSQTRTTLTLAPGPTLTEIIAAVGIPPWLDARVFLEKDGRVAGPVPKALWHRVRPHRGVRVVIRAIPASGGGGNDKNKTLRIVLQIIIIAVAVALIMTGYGAYAGYILVAASIAMMAVNMLLAPPPPKLGQLAALAGSGSGSVNASPTLTITGSQNKANPYGPIPRVYGQHRIYPPFGAVPFTELVGNDQYLRELFVIGYGPIELTDLRIGETPIDTFADVEYEIRQGYPDDAPLTLYTNDIAEDALSITLTEAGGAQSRVGLQEADELSVDIIFPGGLCAFTTTGGTASQSVLFSIEYRKVGDTNWTTVPGSPFEIQDNHTTQVRRGFRWIPTGAPAAFEVRIDRITADSSDPLVRNGSVWSSFRTIRTVPPISMAGLCVVALRIKATDQLNGVIDKFNCLATAILPDWDAGTSTWVTRATRNPAAAYRDVLQGPANARPVSTSRLHLASLEAWAEDTAARGDTFNLVVDFRQTVYQMLADIAAAGRAGFTMIDGLFGVVQDKAQTVPVQHFTPRNSFNFKGLRLFPPEVHAFKVRYINPNAKWQQDEVVVYDEGQSAATATKFEVMETTGITDRDQAWRLGRYHLAVLRLRPEVFELSTDIENLICTRGDLVRLTHDVILVGLATGRITSVAIVGGMALSVNVDEACPMVATGLYAVRIRKADGTSLVRDVRTTEGLVNVLTFANEMPAPWPEAGDLFMFGVRGEESIEALVKDIAYDRDLVGIVRMNPYHAGVYTADTGPIPPYESHITQQPMILRTPPLPVVDAVRSDEDVLQRGLDGTLKPRIVITVHYQANSAIRADWVEVRYRRHDSSSSFTGLPNLHSNTREIVITDVEEGVAYDLHFRTVSLTGAVSPWVDVLNHLVVGKTSQPPDVTGLLLTGSLLTWLYPAPPPDLAGFLVRRSAGPTGDWDNALLLHDGIVSATQLMLPPMYGEWTLMVRAEDAAGNASPTAVSLTHDFGTPPIHNAVESRAERDYTFPGTKTNCSVNGGTGDLEATQESTGFWGPDDSLFWTNPAGLFWNGPYLPMTYAWSYTTGSSADGTTLLIDVEAQGAWALSYRVHGDPDWLPFPGAVTPMAASTEYDFKLDIAGAAVQGKVVTLTIYFDALDILEAQQAVAIAVTTGTRLTLGQTYRAIKTIQLTVQASGTETAIAARAQDKQATAGAGNGPLIQTFDAAGAVVAGHVDVQIVGY